MTHKILISDKFDAEGVSRLQAKDNFEVIYDGGHSREDMLAAVADVHGLIIRSATKVDAQVLEAAPNLKLVVRAGVGVDNIDIPEASRRGVIVMNAPGGNSVSTAEQAVALMMSMARNIPQANASMKSSKWEKSKFKGVELSGKTLGVVGLGRIGKEVVKKARGLGMRVLGYDPYIPEDNLAHLEIDIVSREEVIKQADFITVHTPLTDATRDFLGKDNITNFKKGVRLINCARGGIYNEEALIEALESGHVAGVALDVFSTEPVPEDFPLRNFDNVIMTPHLGASTGDAEFAVAMETIDELTEYFETGIARNALNFPTLEPEALDFLKPYFEGGEKVGKLLAHITEGDIKEVSINYRGDVAAYMTQPVTTAILRGALSLAMGDEVNFVNAPFLARDRGVKVSETKDEKPARFAGSVQAIFKTGKGREVELTYTAREKVPTAVRLFDLPIEFRPEGILIVIENKDVPRVVGTTGMFLGDKNINIASLDLARNEKGGSAHCVITVDDLLTSDGINELRKLENIISAVQVDLG